MSTDTAGTSGVTRRSFYRRPVVYVLLPVVVAAVVVAVVLGLSSDGNLVKGRVTYEGAPVPGVSVTLTDGELGEVGTATTDDQGEFAFDRHNRHDDNPSAYYDVSVAMTRTADGSFTDVGSIGDLGNACIATARVFFGVAGSVFEPGSTAYVALDLPTPASDDPRVKFEAGCDF